MECSGAAAPRTDTGGALVIGASRYEVARLRTLRSTWWLLGISLVVTVAIAFAIGMVSRTNDLEVEYLAIALTAGTEFAPVPLTAVFAGLVGAFSLGHEYRYGTIRPALSAVPRRTALIVAKLAVTSVFAVLLAALNVAAAYVTLLVIPGERLLAKGYGWDAVGRPILGFVLAVLIWGVVGLSLAGLFRNLPATIVVLLVVPLIVESILFAVLQFVPALDDVSWLSKYLPFSAGTAMVAVFQPSDFDQPDFDVATPLQGGLTFGAFGLVLFVAAWLLFRRRDA